VIVFVLNRARISFVLVALIAVAVPAVAAASAPVPVGAKRLSADKVRRVGHVACGRFTSSTQWVPGTVLKHGYFISHDAQARNYGKLARKASGKKRVRLAAIAKRYRTLAKDQRHRCYFPASLPPRVTPPAAPPAAPPVAPPVAPATPLRFDASSAVGLALSDSAGSALGASSMMAMPATPATGSNLVAIDGAGRTHDAVDSGSAAIQRFLIAPNDRVYVVFSSPVNLDNTSPLAPWNPGTRCLIAVVDPASGAPTCVDSQLSFINWSNGNNPAIQFDASGAIYYTGGTTSGTTVLRRYLNGVATDLINDNVYINDFLVRPDGSVFISGNTTSTGSNWVRRITPSGALQSIRSTTSTFLRAFPDGNIYMGLWSGTDLGIRRYLTATNTLDPKFWIANGTSDSEYFAASDYCTGAQASLLSAFCGTYGAGIKGTYLTDNGKVFAIAGYSANGVLMQYFPDVEVPTTIVKNVSVAQTAGNNLILAGRNDQDQNVLTRYNTSTGEETQLIGPDNEIEIYHLNYVARSNKVLFDGLRFADNKYVLGQVDLSTNEVAVSPTTYGKWSDFQTFG
jgi:hypothetical protein